jgi:hypothetical protein
MLNYSEFSPGVGGLENSGLFRRFSPGSLRFPGRGSLIYLSVSGPLFTCQPPTPLPHRFGSPRVVCPH